MRFEQVLVATDFSGASRRAVQLAASVGRLHGSRVVLLHVTQLPEGLGRGARLGAGAVSPEALAREESLALLAEEARPLREAGLEVELRVDFDAAIAARIVAVAEALRADLIVMGTHGRAGLAHLVLGSVAEDVVRLSPVPVLTTRDVGDDDRLGEPEQRLRDETEG
jgi:nucleotide-binding universal stress UspA family protein